MNEMKNGLFLDIGGTLTKVAFVYDSPLDIPHQNKLTINFETCVIYFNFYRDVEECWEFIRTQLGHLSFDQISITGGGAYKYQEQLSKIGIKFEKKIVVVQEFESLLAGISFFKKYSKYEEFIATTIFKEDTEKVKYSTEGISFEQLKQPFLITNIGSGVSFLMINENQKGQIESKRIGGTSLGGGFFLGMANLLTGENNYQKLLEMAQKGNEANTDFTPKDFQNIPEELSEASVLISLGKLSETSSPEDVIRSLFFMVTFNIAQIALTYSEIEGVENVLFTGFFCRQNEVMLQAFAEAFKFFQRKKEHSMKRVYSMKHDGYLGAIGSIGSRNLT